MLSFGPKVWVVTLVTVAAAYIGVVGWSARPLPLPLELRFSKAMPRPVSLSGFSSAEPWGRWSASKEASVSFMGRLPGSFSLILTAKAFGPNTSESIGVTVGDAYRVLPLSAELERHEIFFEGVGASRSVHFTVPHPISPRELQGGDDSRLLGLGIASMEIAPLPGR